MARTTLAGHPDPRISDPRIHDPRIINNDAQTNLDRGQAAELFAADPRIGAWKLVSADSALDPPRVLFTAPQGKGVPVVIPGSTPPRLYCTAAYGGHDNHVQNIPAFHQMVMRRIDKYQSEIKEKKNGALGSDAS